MIQAVIFDCFGVLCHGTLSYFVARARPENRQAVSDTNRAAEYGYMDIEEYHTTMAELLDTTIEDVQKISNEHYVRNEAMFNYARTLKGRGYRLGLLSNVGTGIIEKLFTSGELNELFNEVVLSGEVGMVKPNAEIFEVMASRLQLEPKECVMIDDLIANIDGARSIGMSGVICETVEQVQSDVESAIKASAHA